MRGLGSPPWARLTAGVAIGMVAAAGCRGNWEGKARQAVAQTHQDGESRGSPGGIQFRDVTQEAGINFRHVRASTGRKYFVETMGAGCAFLDYDRDGWVDLLFIQGAPLPGYTAKTKLIPALYRNRGDGTFEEVTQRAGLDLTMYGMGCTVGDYDGDGWLDLYLTAVLGPSHLFRNVGGRFQDVTKTAGVDNARDWGTSCAWWDCDNDGRLDLFICNYVHYHSMKDDLPCYFREGIKSYCIPFAYKGESCRLYRNLGGGRFADATKQMGFYNPKGKSLGVAFWDFNGDGIMDVIVANDTEPTFLYLSEGGKFHEQALEKGIALGEMGTSKAGMGIDVADDRNDGQPSVAITNFAGEMLGFYRPDDSGMFQEIGTGAGVGEASRLFLGFGVMFLDVDNDGFQDIVVANGHVQDDAAQLQANVTYRQRPLLFHNRGDGTYEEIGLKCGPPFAQPIVARGAAYGDYNRDGRLDLIVTENDGPAMLWRNETRNANHWLGIRLLGVRSNSLGMGAKAQVQAEGRTQTHYMRCGSSYLSQHESRLHFGLGRSPVADRVQVTWPSGQTDTLQGVAADRVIAIREGQGLIEGM